ncbi:signal transduction histidine kinase [Kineosphaera limosa]|uniref:Putative two-component histidine kinase n=1 Tax=Kineosphaera limosa NBRC 100340 TaxID=1184609 RepID=K6WKB0_9MICO|nr:sensor histidine kinase [Kineosphaera limosa]NYE02800.1 signal transduction histidine kinase [Kineosphaera limosa]GAB94231.1 putative two-component histidine kinase [Kineosphaera limosa NBRC 100340]
MALVRARKGTHARGGNVAAAPPSARTRAAAAWDDGRLRRLIVVGIAAPVLAIVGLQALGPLVVQALPLEEEHAGVLGLHFAVFVLSATALLFVMRAYRLALSRNRELESLNDILQAISREEAPARTAELILRHARALLAADDAGMAAGGEAAARRPVPADKHVLTGSDARAQGESPTDGPALERPVLWVSRHRRGFERGDQRTLDALARLAGLAQDHGRMIAAAHTTAVLGERVRIAREMHDSLAQVLSVAHLRLWAIGSRPELADEPTGAQLRELADICREAHTDVRESIFVLRETARTEGGLPQALQRAVASFERSAGVPARLLIEGDVLIDMPQARRAEVLRLVQEALTNVRKHARAHAVTVHVHARDGCTLVVVRDDGRGFDSHELGRSDGFGLHTMRERAAAATRHLRVDSEPGCGTSVGVLLPRQREGSPVAVAAAHSLDAGECLGPLTTLAALDCCRPCPIRDDCQIRHSTAAARPPRPCPGHRTLPRAQNGDSA